MELVFAQVPRFYAEIERVARPELRDRPVIVGGDPRKRGLVQAASEEALRDGVTPGASVLEALERCPTARVVRTDMRRYRAISSRLRAHFRGAAEEVELSGLDAAFLAVEGGEVARELAGKLIDRVGEDLSLPLRVGIAPVKFVARLASEEARDGEVVRIAAEDITPFLAPLPVRRLPGVGPRTEERLAGWSVTTIGEMAQKSLSEVIDQIGRHGAAIHHAARGVGESKLRASPHARSVSQEETLPVPELDVPRLHELLRELASGVARGLALEGLSARRLTLKTRYLEGDTVTRSRTMAAPERTAERFFEDAVSLLARTDAGQRAVRLLGLSVDRLLRAPGTDRQLDLFE